MATTVDEDFDDSSAIAEQSVRSSPGEDDAKSSDGDADDGSFEVSSVASLPETYSHNRNNHKYESDDEDEDRENRFQGLSNVWHDYTAEERSLADSLHQQRANDLSIHLYNAHALKLRVRDPDTGSKTNSYHSKKRWVGSDGSGTLLWHPEAIWTSWPLDPEHVPRRNEHFRSSALDTGDDSSTYKMREPWRLSADLEDEVQVLMLKKAKTNLQKQRSNTHQKLGHVRRDSDAQFVMSADDDEAEKLLRPIVRHVLGKFDDLLEGLHQSRQGHTRDSYTTQSGHDRKRQKFKRRAAEAVTSSDEAQDTVRRSSVASRPHRQRLGARDWSEVLGIASLVGWSPDIIARARTRCASLFAENMDLSNALGNGSRYGNSTLHPPTGVAKNGESQSPYPGRSTQWYSCPFEACARNNVPYEKAWRWREHLKRSHKYSNEQIAAIEVERNQFADIDGCKAEGEAEAIDVQAVKSDGGDVQSPPTHPANADGEVEHGQDANLRRLAHNAAMYNGVHLDGFMQPIDIKTVRGKDKDFSERRRAAGRKRRDPSE